MEDCVIARYVTYLLHHRLRFLARSILTFKQNSSAFSVKRVPSVPAPANMISTNLVGRIIALDAMPHYTPPQRSSIVVVDGQHSTMGLRERL